MYADISLGGCYLVHLQVISEIAFYFFMTFIGDHPTVFVQFEINTLGMHFIPFS